MYACNQPATFPPAILLLHLALLISYPSPIPSYPPCSHIYGMVCFLLPYPAACYAHITRLGPRSCCCRLARQTRREAGSGEGRSRLALPGPNLCSPSICSPGSPPLESLPSSSSSRSSLCHFPFSYLPRGDQRGGGHSICLPTRLRGYAMAGLIHAEYCLWLWPKDDPC